MEVGDDAADWSEMTESFIEDGYPASLGAETESWCQRRRDFDDLEDRLLNATVLAIMSGPTMPSWRRKKYSRRGMQRLGRADDYWQLRRHERRLRRDLGPQWRQVVDAFYAANEAVSSLEEPDPWEADSDRMAPLEDGQYWERRPDAEQAVGRLLALLQAASRDDGTVGRLRLKLTAAIALLSALPHEHSSERAPPGHLVTESPRRANGPPAGVTVPHSTAALALAV